MHLFLRLQMLRRTAHNHGATLQFMSVIHCNIEAEVAHEHLDHANPLASLQQGDTVITSSSLIRLGAKRSPQHSPSRADAGDIGRTEIALATVPASVVPVGPGAS